MGQTSAPVAAPLLGPPKLMFEARSCERPGSGLVELGEPDPGESIDSPIDPPIDGVLSEGAYGLVARCTAGDAVAALGGARPFPLPRMRPPPSLRLDMAGGQAGRQASWAGIS